MKLGLRSEKGLVIRMSDKIPGFYSNHNKHGCSRDAESDNPKNNQIIIGMDAIRNQLEGP
jgi:hypothetical protein